MSANQRKPLSFQRKSRLLLTILLAILVAFLVWLPLMLVCGCGMEPPPSSLSSLRDRPDGRKPAAYVAHALGGIDNDFYTNSREAFLLNYEKGFRTFEVDLVLLKDGSVFCAHDGAEWMYGLDKPFLQTTVDELAGRACLGKYTSLTGGALLDLAYEYRDARFLLHTKHTTKGATHDILRILVSEAKGRQPSVLDRMIPRTFGLDDLRKAAQIYHFTDYWVDEYCHKLKSNGSSGLNRDQQIVFYIIGRGAAPQPTGTADAIRASCASIAGPLLLPCCAFRLIPCPYDVRLYVSVDNVKE